MMKEDKRIILMSKMALYDEGNKKKSMKVCNFFKKDYVTFQTIMTLLWATLGYAFVAGGMVFLEIEEITSSLSFDLIIELAILISGGYVITLFVMGAIAVLYYTFKYKQSLHEAKKYYKALGMLNRDYKKEK